MGAVGLTGLFGLDAGLTVIENGAREAAAVESLAEMTMFASVPTSVDAGVPDKVPVAMLSEAHAGLFWMLNDTGLPLCALMVGVKLYVVATVAVVGGVPEIVGGAAVGGALLAGAVTVMLKGDSDDDFSPSLTLMMMLE